MDQRRHDPGAGLAERVAEGDRPAVDVELVPADTELLGRRDHLGGERLVQLDQVDVVDRQPGARQRHPARLDRSEAHDLRVEPGDAARDDAGRWGDAELLGLGVAHHQHGRGAVVEWAGVAGGDAAVAPEGRLERGEAVERRAGAGQSSVATTVPSGSVTGVMSFSKEPLAIGC